MGALVGQGFPFWADEAVALGVEDEGVAGQLAVGWCLRSSTGMCGSTPRSISQLRNAPVPYEPSAAAVRSPTETFMAAVEHGPGGDDLLAQARGGRLDVHDHRVGGVD